MKNYRKSDYALNKFSEGIVYQFSDRTLEISLEDFLRANPGKTEADFMTLKGGVSKWQKAYSLSSSA